jgi:hypothetical protein
MTAKRLVRIALGAFVVLAVAAFDPGALLFLLDVEFVAMLGTIGVAMTSANAGVVIEGVVGSTPVTLVRAGLATARERPASLLGSTLPH